MNSSFLAFMALSLVIAANARPQLHFTPREHRAFNAVLGKSKAVSISRAIPVMAFSDSNPSKFVELPVEKLGLAPFARGGNDLHPAELLGFETEVSNPHIEKQTFHETFGRGSSQGPIINEVTHQSFQQSASPVIHNSVNSNVQIHDNSHREGKFIAPKQLHFGFKPLYESHVENAAQFKSQAIQNIHHGSGDNNVHQQSFGSSPVVNAGFKNEFQPVIHEFSDFNLQPEQGKFAGISTGEGHVVNVQPQFETLGKLTDDNLEFDLTLLGKTQTSNFDFTNQEIFGKGGSVSQVDSGENLYRHHVPSSLIPTENAGPGTTAVGKLLKNRGQDSTVFTRSIGSSKKNPNVIVISEHPEKSQKNSVKPSPILISSGSEDLTGLKFVKQNGAIVLENPKNSFKFPSDDNNNFKFPSENDNDEEVSIFKSSSVTLPELPNIQLPLQDASVSEQKIIPQIPSFQSPNNKQLVTESVRQTVVHEFNREDPSIVFKRVSSTPLPTKIRTQRQPKQSSSFRQSTRQHHSSQQFSSPQQTNQHQFSRQQQKNKQQFSRPQQSNHQQFSSQQQKSQQQFSRPQQSNQQQFSSQQQRNQQQFSRPQQINQQQFSRPQQISQQQFSRPQQINQQQFSRPQQTPQKQFSAQQINQPKNSRQQQSNRQQVSNQPQTNRQQISIQQSQQQFNAQQQRNHQQKDQQQLSKQPNLKIPSSVNNKKKQNFQNNNSQQGNQRPTIQRVELTEDQLRLLQQRAQKQHKQQLQQPNLGLQLSKIVSGSNRPSTISSSSKKVSSSQNSGTTITSASSPFSSLPPSVLSALGGGGLAGLGGAGGAGGEPQIIVKTLELDASDADPSSLAFKEALAKATKEARLELGVSSSEELGVGGADLASLFGKRRRKRQLFGGVDASTSQSLGTGLSTGAGLYDDEDADEIDE